MNIREEAVKAPQKNVSVIESQLEDLDKTISTAAELADAIRGEFGSVLENYPLTDTEGSEKEEGMPYSELAERISVFCQRLEKTCGVMEEVLDRNQL